MRRGQPRPSEDVSPARRRVLLAAIERAFARTPLELGRTPAERDLVARARRCFLQAGEAFLEAELGEASWIQFDVGFRSAAQADAFLDRRLADTVRRWMSAGLVREFAFMRKSPGVRLRFLAPVSTGELRATIQRHLSRSLDRGAVDRYELGLYEPETHLFGGPAGIELFHRFATIDSLTVLDALTLMRERRAALARGPMSLMLLGVLLDIAVPGGGWEHWDVWENMRETERTFEGDERGLSVARESVASNRALLMMLAKERDSVFESLSRRERALIASYRASLAVWSGALQRVVRRGGLTRGVRKILPFYIIFHWNRLGLSLSEQCFLTLCMQTLLAPEKRDRLDDP